MTEIIEIVFERVQLEKIAITLFELLSNSNLIDSYITTDVSKIDFQSKEKLHNSLVQSSEGAFSFYFLSFKLVEIQLHRVLLQIHKCNNVYDVNIIIEEKELIERVSILELHKYVAILAEELEATNFYCGFEPAMDKETRLFTGKNLGPLKLRM